MKDQNNKFGSKFPKSPYFGIIFVRETTSLIEILELTLPDGEVCSYPLDVAGGVTNIGRHRDNDIVIDHPDINPFHLVLDHQERPFQVIALRKSETGSDGSQLVLEKIGELQDRESFEVAGHVLRLLQPEEPVGAESAESAEGAESAAGAEGSEGSEGAEGSEEVSPSAAAMSPAPNVSDFPAPADQVWDDSDLIELEFEFLTVDLPLESWIIKPGQNSVRELVVSNRTFDDITCDIRIKGLIAPWVTISPATLLLQAGEQAKVVLSCLLPKRSSSRAGTHPLTIVVASSDDPDEVIEQKMIVRIPPFYGFSVAPLSPQHQSLPFWRSDAKVMMKVTNRGNSEAAFHIIGFAVGTVCRFSFQLPDGIERGHAKLRLSAGESLAFPVRIAPSRVPLFGMSKQTHHFALRTTMLNADTQTEAPYYTVGGHLTTRPLIGSGVLALLITCLLLMGLFFFPPLDLPQNGGASQDSSSSLFGTSPEAEVTLNNEPLMNEEIQSELEAWLHTEVAVVATAEPSTNGVALNYSHVVTYEVMFRELGAQYDLDWQMLAAIAYRESTLNPNATGQDGDMGLMQIMPFTWNEVAPSLGVSDPYDAYGNAQVGATYLAYLRDHFAGLGYHDQWIMLIAYNWGPSNLHNLLQNNGSWKDLPPSTQQYALAILEIRGGGFPPEMEALLQKLVEVRD